MTASTRSIVARWMVFCAVLGGPATSAARSEAGERLFLKNGIELAGESLGPLGGALRFRTLDGQERLVPLDLILRIEIVQDTAVPVLLPDDGGVNESGDSDASPADDVRPPPSARPSIFLSPFQWLEAAPDISGTPADDLTRWSSDLISASFLQGPFPSLDGAYEYTVETLSAWTKRLEVGGRFLDGNKNQDYLDVNGKLERVQGRQMFSGEFGGQFGQSDGRRVANRWYANGTQDFSRDGKWIVYFTSKNEFDEFEHLDYRGTLSSGFGYRFFNDKERRWIARVGPGLTHEIFEEPHRDETTLDLFVESELKWPVLERVRVENKATFTPSIDDFQVFRLLSDSGLLFQLDNDERWLLKLGMRLEYNSEPNPGRLPADYTSSILLVYTRK